MQVGGDQLAIVLEQPHQALHVQAHRRRVVGPVWTEELPALKASVDGRFLERSLR
jgi:hypothetical protein